MHRGAGVRAPMHAMSIAMARKALLDLPEVVQAGPVFAMRHGHPVLVLLSVDQFEGMLGTIEILSDRAFAKRLRERIEQAKAGKTVGLDEASVRSALSPPPSSP